MQQTSNQVNSVRTLVDKRASGVSSISQCNIVKAMKSVLVVTIVVAYFAIVPGNAMECYTCESQVDPACENTLVNISTIACAEGQMCIKIVQDGKIIRDCNSLQFHELVNGSNTTEVFTCDTDKCNGVSSIAAGLSTFLALIAVIVFGVYN